jgi:hypothetical protein
MRRAPRHDSPRAIEQRRQSDPGRRRADGRALAARGVSRRHPQWPTERTPTLGRRSHPSRAAGLVHRIHRRRSPRAARLGARHRTPARPGGYTASRSVSGPRAAAPARRSPNHREPSRRPALPTGCVAGRGGDVRHGAPGVRPARRRRATTARRRRRTASCDRSGAADAAPGGGPGGYRGHRSGGPGEIDFARLCRRAGLPEPRRQSVRLEPSGRRRYLDAEWRRADGRTVVAEVDGALHLVASTWWAEQLRQNEIVLSDTIVLRFSCIVVRTEPGVVIGQLRRALLLP